MKITGDQIKLPNPSGKFRIVCGDCGSDDVAVVLRGYNYDSDRNHWPEIHCNKCDNVRDCSIDPLPLKKDRHDE